MTQFLFRFFLINLIELKLRLLTGGALISDLLRLIIIKSFIKYFVLKHYNMLGKLNYQKPQKRSVLKQTIYFLF